MKHVSNDKLLSWQKHSIPSNEPDQCRSRCPPTVALQKWRGRQAGQALSTRRARRYKSKLCREEDIHQTSAHITSIIRWTPLGGYHNICQDQSWWPSSIWSWPQQTEPKHVQISSFACLTLFSPVSKQIKPFHRSTKAQGQRKCRRTVRIISSCCCYLVACLPTSNVYLRDGSAKTIVRTATLSWKLQIKLAVSTNHSLQTPGKPVLALTLQCQSSGRVATRVPVSKSLVFFFIFFSVPTYVSGVHHFGWDFYTCDNFFNPTRGSHWKVRAGRVFVASIYPSRAWKSGSFVCDGMHVCTD